MNAFPIVRRASFAAGVFAALLPCVRAAADDATAAPAAFLQPVPWMQVKLADAFFRPLQERIRDVTHAHSRKKLEEAHAFELIDRAAHKLAHPDDAPPEWKRPYWNDHDVFKLVESMAYTLGTDPSPERDAEFDAMVARIAAMQQQDGYVNSWFEVYAPQDRLKNLADCHELYCAGHLIEAAVAHHQATGKRNLLDVALKYAEFIDRRFRTDRDALPGYCGHPEIELALVRLADDVGDPRWFELAATFIDRRGSHYFARERQIPDDKYEGEYFQDHKPLVQQRKIVGHAVRAGYVWSGATDVAGRRGDAALLGAVDAVWSNTVGRRMFVTGGIGAAAANEGFTQDFDLPTATAYQETCASIAFMLWNERLGRLKRDGRYHDLFERSLLNAVLAGYSQDGCHFFYANPLASAGGAQRPEWYDCACCPNNVTRILAGLGRFVASTSDDALWLHLPIAGTIDATVGGHPVRLAIESSYPRPGHGRITVHVPAPTEFTIRLRCPSWATGPGAGPGAGAGPATNPGYLAYKRTWSDGATIDFQFDAEVRRLAADPRAESLRGEVALAYGPFVCCVEQCDVKAPIDSIFLPESAVITARELAGRDVLVGEARTIQSHENWPGGLYAAAPTSAPAPFRAIPYYSWAERGGGAMRVWLPTAPPPPRVRGLEATAHVQTSSRGERAVVEAAAGGAVPRNSHEHPGRLCHFWPHAGGTEWIEYAWEAPRSIGSTRVYWFDDTGSGACRAPKTARLLWRDGDAWKPVPGGDLPVALDRWCELEFPAVTTTALRLEITQADGFASGVLGWNVFDD